MPLPFDAVPSHKQDRYRRAPFSRAAHRHSDWHLSSVITEHSSALGHFSLHFFSLLFPGFTFLESTLIAHFSFLTKKKEKEKEKEKKKPRYNTSLAYSIAAGTLQL